MINVYLPVCFTFYFQETHGMCLIFKFCFEQLKFCDINVVLSGEMHCNIKQQQIEKMLQKHMKHNGSLIKYNENRKKNRN